MKVIGRPRGITFVATLLLAFALPATAQEPARASAEMVALAEANARYIEPPAPIAEFFRRDGNFATLDAPSPDGRFFLVPQATQLSTLELMVKPTHRLAELEIRPATDRLWHLDTYGINGLRVYDLQDRRFRDISLPAGTFISDLVWSPDGARVAFLTHLPRGTEVWTADPATGRASRFSAARVLATIGTSAHVNISPEIDLRTSRMLQWTPEGTLLTLVVPADRGREPVANAVPSGPMVRLTRPEATATRTFPNLLRTEHDAALFEHYTRSQLVELAAGRAPRAIGEPRMYESIALSADGRHILAGVIERPFSFITSWRGFPGKTMVLDRTGATVATVEARGLREGGGGPGGGGLRGLAWRPDGAGLSYLRRADAAGGSGGSGGDHVMLLAAPFDTAAATTVASSPDNIAGVSYSRDGRHAFATVTRNGRTAIVRWELAQPEPERRILSAFHHPDSLFALPGALWTERTPNGIAYAIVSAAGDAVYLRGDGLARDFRPQPFVDRVTLADTVRTRIFEGAKSTWDRPLVALDHDLRRMIVGREGRDLFPDSHLWTPGAELVNLTRNANPFPELAAARRIDFSFTRRDGLEVQGRISLPLGWREGDKAPAIFWTYPREFTTPEGYSRAAARARNHNAYTHLTWLRWSELWLTQGYALVYPDIPIIGENYNDTYIANMVDAMYAAMRAVDRLGVVDMDRIGHGGHSYGAFATANLLAHTPFFRAGIAGDGAYNRSLTPTGFQAEPRTMWTAPQTYLDMSPFFKADQIDSPLLMYHGADDNNTGTWPMQSERLMQALTSLGKNAALYVYPYESHTPRAIENNLDLWARWIDWFDRYVKANGTTADILGGGH
ncbi:MAG TPA: prolyl oligopeptidase family serine peptidase [Gemmatimonadaceae bacterium]|nr:prolyl oligopeptidase family serine peptidase [Gemmatimonadaceae bacterium]